MLNTGIEVRIFIGFQLRHDIKLALERNIQWKNHQLTQQQKSPLHIHTEHYQKNEYLGFYVDKDRISLEELADYQKKLEHELTPFLDSIERIKLKLFPQIFIS